MQEIKQDLKNHFQKVELKLLFQKKGVAFLETFFKQKYESCQATIGQLTEYFSFSKQEIYFILQDFKRLLSTEMPERDSVEWVFWAYLRFNQKIYGHREKSVYVDGQSFLLSQKEEQLLLRVIKEYG